MMTKKIKNILDTAGMPVIAPASPPILSSEQITNATKLPVSEPINKNAAPEKPAVVSSGKPEVFRDQDTGKLSGVRMPDGKIFLGISEAEVRGLTEKNASKMATPAGAIEAPQAKQQQELAQTEQNLLTSGSNMEITPDGRQAVPDENIISKGATGAAAIGGAVIGAKAGALTGTLIAPGIGTVVGGIIGAAGGAVGGAYAKMTIQKRQNVKESMKVFNQAKTNKNEILNMINARLLSEGQARDLWQEEKQNIASSYSFLKMQTQSNLDDFLGNPGDEFIVVEGYLALDNFYDLEFEKALLQPNPAKIRYQQTEAIE
jgi:gas vesicle protein